MSGFKYAALLVPFLAFSGCAVVGPSDLSPEAAVEVRAQERHKALLAKDFDASYKFMSPGYRSSRGMNEYKLDYAGTLNWQSLTVESVTCEEERCEVDATLEYVVKGGTRPSDIGRTMVVPRTNTEIWVKLNGEWWFVRTL